MSRQARTDPGPLKVEQPRLPWWTMSPRKLLHAASPIILVAVLSAVLVFVARRMLSRYPLFVMTSPSPSDSAAPGLQPLDTEPLSVHPPYTTPHCWDQDHSECYLALLTALEDLELGSYDVSVLGWLSGQGTGPVAVICSLFRRIRAAARGEGNQHP